MAKLIMMVGVPGSGKSTYTKKIAEKEQAVILSSDKIYVEITGDVTNSKPNDGKVFDELYKRTREYLKQGTNVIIDATNSSAKKRKGVLQQFKGASEKECYYICTPFETCVKRDKERERTVGYGVIKGMYLRLFIPFVDVLDEGFDKVHYRVSDEFEQQLNGIKKEVIELLLPTNEYDKLFKTLSVIPDFASVYELPQDSTYHTFSVSRHIFHVLKYVNDRYHEDDKLVMQYTALFHDIGKAMAKNFKDDQRYANFIGHENASAQIAMGLLTALGYEESFVVEVTKLVQLHMRLPREDATEKAFEKFKKEVNQKTYKQLEFFRQADNQAK
jgi:predicted kinase